MDQAPVKFTLEDDEGNTHSYLVVLHQGREGYEVACEIMALLSGPVVSAVGALAGQAADAGGTQLGHILELDFTALDFGGLSTGLGAALVRMPKLTHRILAHTRRDDRSLAEGANFDAAFRGNYSEAALAVWRVVQSNRFLPLSRISRALAAAKAEAEARKAAASLTQSDGPLSE